MNTERSLSAQLRAALVEAFPRYVMRRLHELEAEVPQDVVAQSTSDLNDSLLRMEQSPSDLGESPLELVRIATEPLTAALREAGMKPVERDAQAVELHPDDVFDLYPATSRDLGEEVWRVHMQWGLERARLVAGMVPASSPEGKTSDSAAQSRTSSSRLPDVPAVALFGVAEPLRAQLADRIRSLGYQPLIWRNPAALEEYLGANPALALVDLRHPKAEGALRRLVAEGINVVGCRDGVTDFTRAAMMALGADDVVESDRIVERLDSFLPRLA